MIEYNLSKDASCVEKTSSMNKLYEQLFSHYAFEVTSCKEDGFSVDIGIGKILVCIEQGEVIYSYIPSDGVQSAVSSGIRGESKLVESQKSVLKEVLEEINGRADY